jgi:hypothetical protein
VDRFLRCEGCYNVFVEVVMKTINPDIINKQVNKCYLDYDPEWPKDMHTRVLGFKYYLERTAGLKLDFEPKINEYGKFGYELKQAEIVNEPAFTMWLLRWS